MYGEISQPFGFTGYMFDPIANTSFAQAREYKPEIGRFTSTDPHWHLGNMIYGDMNHEPWEIHNGGPDQFAIRQSGNLYDYTLGNPVNYIDPDGRCIRIITTGIGAIVGVGSQLVSDIVTSAVNGEWSFSSWETYVGAAAGGAAAGNAISRGVFDPRALGAISNGTSTFVTQNLESLSGRNERSFGEIAFNTVFAAGVGYVLGGLFDRIRIPGVNQGRWNLDSRFRSLMTRFLNGNAQNMGWNSIRNGFVSMFVGGSWESIFAGITGSDLVEGLWNRIFGLQDSNSLQDVVRELFFNLFRNPDNDLLNFDFPICD